MICLLNFKALQNIQKMFITYGTLSFFPVIKMLSAMCKSRMYLNRFQRVRLKGCI